jgi:TPR repeat protein
LEDYLAGEAQLYREGKIIPQDYNVALFMLHKAAEQGNSLAQFNLGVMCAAGEGLKQDLVQAYKWFSLAGIVAGEEATKNMSLVEAKMTAKEIETAQTLVREWQEKHK